MANYLSPLDVHFIGGSRVIVSVAGTRPFFRTNTFMYLMTFSSVQGPSVFTMYVPPVLGSISLYWFSPVHITVPGRTGVAGSLGMPRTGEVSPAVASFFSTMQVNSLEVPRRVVNRPMAANPRPKV